MLELMTKKSTGKLGNVARTTELIRGRAEFRLF